MLFTYYREEKIFRSGRQKNGRINGVSFGQSYVWAGSQALYGYRVILENYRASADYEFYENYGIEFHIIRLIIQILLILVIAWNYGFPQATPFQDVIVAVFLSILFIIIQLLQSRYLNKSNSRSKFD